MFKGMSFFVRIFLCLMVVIFIATAVPAYFFSNTIEQNLLADTEEEAFEKLEIMTLFFMENAQETRPKIPYADIEKELETLQLRLTLIDKQGEVIYDSQVAPEKVMDLDNHADRIEVKGAITNGRGVSSRYSNTLKTNFIYVAKTLENGDLLRIAYPYKNLEARMENVQNTLMYVFMFAMFFALIIAFTLSFNIKKQLKTMIDVVDAISLGKFGSRLHHVPGQEFSVLANAVNRMAENIENQLDIMQNQASQLKVIFNTMQDGILLLDSKGNIRHSNEAVRVIAPQILEKAKMISKNNSFDFDIMPLDVNVQVIECIHSSLLQKAVELILLENSATTSNTRLTSMKEIGMIQTGKLSYYIEIELFQGRFFAIYLAKPENPTLSMGLVIVIHEITDMVRLENVRRDFVANVSHELRTPLTSIQGYAETLSTMPELTEDCKRFAQIIYKHGTYLNNMIEDLLALARIENPSEECVFTNINANDALLVAVGFCDKAMQKQGLTLESSLPDDMSTSHVHANKTNIERVFRNLLENACRYALPQSVLRVFAQKEDDVCTFTIENQGTLIPQEDIERIFERFYRVEKGRTGTNGNGDAGTSNGAATGLGLAICKHIIERHNGRIWAQSVQQENGTAITSFHFTLQIEKKTNPR